MKEMKGVFEALDFLKNTSDAATTGSGSDSARKTVAIETSTPLPGRTVAFSAIETSTPLPGRKMPLTANQVSDNNSSLYHAFERYTEAEKYHINL